MGDIFWRLGMIGDIKMKKYENQLKIMKKCESYKKSKQLDKING